MDFQITIFDHRLLVARLGGPKGLLFRHPHRAGRVMATGMSQWTGMDRVFQKLAVGYLKNPIPPPIAYQEPGNL